MLYKCMYIGKRVGICKCMYIVTNTPVIFYYLYNLHIFINIHLEYFLCSASIRHALYKDGIIIILQNK